MVRSDQLLKEVVFPCVMPSVSPHWTLPRADPSENALSVIAELVPQGLLKRTFFSVDKNPVQRNSQYDNEDPWGS